MSEIKEEIIERRLLFVFQTVNEHLRFAESKNISTLVVSIGVLTAVFTIGVSNFPSSFWAKLYLFNIIGMMVLSLLCSICSFSPRTFVSDALLGIRGNSPGNNAIFFNHIASMTERQFLVMYIEEDRYEDASKFFKDISHQVVANSRIARKKFAIYAISLWLLVAAFLSPLGAYILLNLYMDEAI